jgi:hypothetical protein
MSLPLCKLERSAIGAKRNYFLGGVVGFVGVVGVNLCFGIWWLPFTLSPKTVLSTPLTMFDSGFLLG